MQNIERIVLFLAVFIQIAGTLLTLLYPIYHKPPLVLDGFIQHETSRKSTWQCLNMQNVDSVPTATVKLSPMVENMAISKTIQIHAMTKELEKAGKEVFSLCVGEPDYQPPKVVLEATAKAAMDGITKYTAVTGEAQLRTAIANDLAQRKHTQYTAEQIVVSNGAKQSVLQALMAVVSPGDEVLIPSPYWTSYPDMVKMCQATPVIVQTKAAEDFTLSASALRSALQSHPKVSCIILCNPSNPTGCLADKTNSQLLAKVLEEFPQVLVISDEIYEHLVYDGREHTSFASISPQMYARTVTINGFSKSHAMTGYRIGYSASSLQIAKAIGKLQSQMTSCASSISQQAAISALTNPTITSSNWMKERVQELQQKRDFAYQLLMDIPKVTCPKPTGAFYLLPDVSAYYGKSYSHADGEVIRINNSHELCVALLKAETVALVSGEAFGDDSCVRLSYATSMHIIEQSLKRLKKFLLALH